MSISLEVTKTPLDNWADKRMDCRPEASITVNEDGEF